MANTFDIGPLFFHLLSLEKAPVVHFGTSQEVSPPFRCSRVAIVRMPFGKGLAIGWWKNRHLTEEQALLRALEGWGVDLYDEDLEDPETRACIRENVAKATACIEDEWLIVDALGLEK